MENSASRQSARTHDISLVDYHVKDIKAFGEALTNAASAAFPSGRHSRYKGVYVLLLSWEMDNLGVIREIMELQEVFRSQYHFETEEWKIPSHKSHNSLSSRILNFVESYDDKNNLLIIYYGGHGGMNDDRHCIWHWYATSLRLGESVLISLLVLGSSILLL